MAKNLTLCAALVIFLGVGLWNVFSSGPGNSEPANVVQARLAKLPMSIGGWEGQDLAVNEKHMKVSHAEAYLNRSYTDKATGATVNFMILYGNPGDLGAHDPKVCYGSNGYELASRYDKRSDGGNEFWTAKFQKPGPTPSSFEVLWAWGTGPDWQAPDSPRLAFAGEGRIYKIYIQHPLREENNAAAPIPLNVFLPEFLNALRKELTAPL